MKMRILTQPLGRNIGGILQNFALTTVCKRFSNDVKTFNIPMSKPIYFPIIKYGACIKRIFLKLFFCRKTTIRWWLEELPLRIPQKKNVIKLSDSEKLKRLNMEDVCFVFGSDQIWRKIMSPFGVDYWQFSNAETQKIILLLKKFKAISVREESAVRLLKERGIDAQLVLDPTLLLQSDNYTGLETDVSRQFANYKHVFLYCLDKHPLQDEMIVLVNEKKKMPVMNIMANLQIDSWISGLRTADYVVTDSFHGTVFSILFHKKFIVLANEQRGLTRLQSLLKMFGLENRLIMSFEDFDCEKLDAEIDYKSVDVILNQEREKSLTFLSESLSS